MALAGRMGWSIWGTLLKLHRTPTSGAVAQLGERLVRNEEATGSIPVSSTISSTTCGPFLKTIFKMEPFYWNTNGTRFASRSTYSLSLAEAAL